MGWFYPPYLLTRPKHRIIQRQIYNWWHKALVAYSNSCLMLYFWAGDQKSWKLYSLEMGNLNLEQVWPSSHFENGRDIMRQQYMARKRDPVCFLLGGLPSSKTAGVFQPSLTQITLLHVCHVHSQSGIIYLISSIQCPTVFHIFVQQHYVSLSGGICCGICQTNLICPVFFHLVVMWSYM